VPASQLKACRVAPRNGGEQWQARPRSAAQPEKQSAGVAAGNAKACCCMPASNWCSCLASGSTRACVQAQPARRATLTLQWRRDADSA
jgi:hypothetical protein